MDRLGSDLGVASDGSCLPQSAASLGVHVDSLVCHLSQSEVADMVEGANTKRSLSVALSSLSSGLAGNGRRSFLGCESARTPARAHDLALGDVRNDPRCNPALGGAPIGSARTTPSTRMGGNVGSHPAPSLRYFPNRCSPVAEHCCQCKSHHVCPTPLNIPWRVLGKRWNLGFRQLSHELIFRPLHRRLGADAAGFLVFTVSGLIHDLVISLPARGGYGLPTAYFLLQGVGITIERSRLGTRLGLGQGVRGWCFMAVFLAAPVFWLFHPWFVLRVILPFMRAIHAL